MINIYTITAWLTTITAFCIGIFIYIRNPKRDINKRWFFVNISIAIWSLFLGFLFNSKDAEIGLICSRILMVGANLIPITFYHFVLALLEQQKDKKQKRLLLAGYLITFFLLLINFSPLFIKGTSYKEIVRCFYPDAGSLFILYILIYFGLLGYACFLMYMATKTSTAFRRNQIRYVLFTSVVAFLGGATTFPLWYQIQIPPFGTHFVWLYTFILTIAIVKYRLMDIKLARQYIAIYIFYGLMSLAVFVPLLFLFRHSILGLMATGFVIILSAPYFHRRMTKFLEPTFLGQTYRRGEQLDRLKEADLGYISEQIAWNLVGGISEIMQVDRVSLFLYVDNRKEFRPYAQLGLDEEIGTEQIPWVKLPLNDSLVKHLSEVKKPIIKEELAGLPNIVDEMKRLYAEISVPLFVQDELIGILNLGPKPNEEMYHQEELKKITDLCHQAENHLSHTRFMEKRATFSRELAHDMKNLVAKAIEPTVEAILETKDPQKKEQELKSLIRQLGYLRYCLQGNFDEVSLVERLAYHKYTFEPTQIAKVIAACASLYKNSLTKADIALEQLLPKDLPLVLANREDIPKVFNNLLDNALKFTPPGGRITIEAQAKEDNVLITFTDTGKGFAKEEIEHIFEPKLKMPEEGQEGTGLGLVIVRDIIEAHKGRIEVESEPGKGTSFYFTLRIAKENENKGEAK